MTSHIAETVDGGGIRRHWSLLHLTGKGVFLPCVGDTIVYNTISLTITHIGQDKDNYPIWVGTIAGAEDKYDLDDGTIVVWGRKGTALNITYYLEGKYYTFTRQKSYLWT